MCKHPVEKRLIIEKNRFIQDLKQIDKLLIHLDDNLNLNLLSQLDPDKVEVLVNKPCIVNCPNRKNHYHKLFKAIQRQV